MIEVKFEELKGKTLTKVDGLKNGEERVTFTCSDGTQFEMYHSQDCCEYVRVEDVFGDVSDIVGSPILEADESSSSENPDDARKETIEYQDSFTWTFYKLGTLKGSVTVRWYGSSNGYYGESVDFVRTK